MQLRISMVAAVFAKTLRLPYVSRSMKDKNGKKGTISSSSGQIMNLVSNDVERFLLSTLFISYIIWAPLEAIAILIIGLYLVGAAFSVGLGFLLLIFVPLQFWLSKRFAILRSKVI